MQSLPDRPCARRRRCSGKVAVDAKLDEMDARGRRQGDDDRPAFRTPRVRAPTSVEALRRREHAHRRDRGARASRSSFGGLVGSRRRRRQADRIRRDRTRRASRTSISRGDREHYRRREQRLAVARLLREGRVRAADRHDRRCRSGMNGNGHAARRGERRRDRGEGEVDALRAGEGDVHARRPSRRPRRRSPTRRRGEDRAEDQGQVPRDIDGRASPRARGARRSRIACATTR